MKHIAILIPTIDRLGGAELQAILLAKGLAGRGLRVTLVALSGAGGPSAVELKTAGVDFLSLEMRKGLADPRGWIRLHRWLRQEIPDVVHAHMPHATWLARWSRLRAPFPVLIDSVHTSATGTIGRRIGYRASGWLGDRVTAVSQDVADAYTAARMVSRARLLVLPNGVNVDHWQPRPEVRIEVRQRLGLSDEFLWFAAGRLDPVKDYPALLWAMMEVPHAARLVIAGAGPVERKLRRMAIEFGLGSRVRFLGFEPNVLPWMQAADAFVLSSRWEGLPMSLLEAAACALPAVATDVPGTHELIEHGVTGLLAPAGSSVALRNAMTRMMRLTPEQRFTMGERARQRILQYFSLEAILDRWVELYTDLLNRNSTPARRGRDAGIRP